VTAPTLATLKVGGYTPFSATDYPGQLAAVVFVQGCPWACCYCHNPHLQNRTAHSPIAWGEVVARLKRRVGLIDAVVFSGGEPTLDPALMDAMREVRALGFAIGLHTAGMYPRRLIEVLPLVDWVGLDIKSTPDHYDALTSVPGSAPAPMESAAHIIASGVAHECRTTVYPGVHDEANLLALAQHLAKLGVQHYALQMFRDTRGNSTALSACLGAKALTSIQRLFQTVTVRS